MSLVAMLLLMLLAAASGSVISNGQWFQGSFMLGCVIFVSMIVIVKAEKVGEQK